MTHDLKRWSEDAPEGYRAAKRAHAEIGPRTEQLDRVLERVEHALQASGASAASGRGARASAFRAKPWLWLVPVIGVLGGVFLFVAVEPSQRGAAPAPRAGVALAPAAENPALTPGAPARPSGFGSRADPRASTAQPETSVPPAAVQQESSRAKSPTASDPLAELALLERARRVLATNPVRALALTEQHRQRYRAGQFAEERELLAIQALIGAGQRSAAERRARSFSRAHPNSVHAHRLGVILQREAP
jgi:hypothetical protein